MDIFLMVTAFALGAAAVALLRRAGAGGGALQTELRSMSDRFGAETALLRERLEGIDGRMIQTQVAGSELARGIFDTLGDVRRATTTVADQAREFSALQDLLRAPKMRGGLGEAMLEELLRQVLPPSAYSMQWRFSTGATVDAVVRAGGRLVCIDSKFPLSNYRRMADATDDIERADAERAFAGDIERHIKDISSRYVIPDEQTLDFAVMYVPAEGLYAEVLRLAHRRKPLFETAIESRVVPMSPLTLYGYLQTILYGLRCLKIERSAEAVLDGCGRLQQDFERFATEYETLGRHLTNARTKHEEGQRRLDRLRDKVTNVVELADDDSRAKTDGVELEAVGDRWD
ncbi:MAG: DNA recombination protein RmuC [Actinomycetota bacterium]